MQWLDFFRAARQIKVYVYDKFLPAYIPAGTTVRRIRDTEKQITFSPEYIGEAMHPPWLEEDSCGAGKTVGPFSSVCPAR